MLHYKTKGAGNKQIIFVHGNSQSLEVWDDLTDSAALQAQYRLIAVDLPGHGNSFRSNKPEEDYSLKGFAACLKLFIEQFENTDYILVANSFGANVIGEMLQPFKNCRGLMLIGSTALGKGLGADSVILPNPNLGICFATDFTEEQLNHLIEDAAFNLSSDNKEKVSIMFKNADPALRSVLGSCISKQEYGDELMNLEQLKLPIAVVYGREEKICATGALDKIEFPKWKNETFLISESGHCCQLDAPLKLTGLIQVFAADCFE